MVQRKQLARKYDSIHQNSHEKATRDWMVAAFRVLFCLSVLVGSWSSWTVSAASPPASPVEVPQGWQRLGPYGGKVVDVAYAPSDPNIVYALLDNETVPVYKSIDNGMTWNFLVVPFDVLRPESLAVSPVNPAIVLFSDAFSIFRSSNGGMDWTRSDQGYVNPLKFSLANRQKVYGINGSNQLIKSMDSGLTWEVATDHYVRSFALDPFNENRILVTAKGTRIEDRGLFESTDDGVTWNLLGFETESIRSVEFSKTSGVIYLIKYYDTAVWKSSDNGATWSILTDSFASDILDFDVTGATTEELFVTVENFGAAFESNIWRSNDGGVTWVNVPSRWAYFLYDKVAVDPSDSNHFIGYQEWCGMHFTWDAGVTWTRSGSVFPGIPLQHIGVSPVREGLMLVQTVNGYNLRSLDSGQTWEFTHFKNEKSGGFGFAFCLNNDQCVYWISGGSILSGCKLHKSQNGGLDWQDVTPDDFTYPSSIAVHPDNDAILLCGSQNGVLIRSVDAGQNWTEVYNAQNTAVQITFIQFKPLDSSVVYAGTINWMTSEVKLIKSTNSGTTWVEVSQLPTSYLHDLTVTYTEPEILFESTGQGLLKSFNQGLDWEKIGLDIDLQSDKCLVSARNPNWVWVTGSSFALSTDMGQNWAFSSRFAIHDDAAVDYNSNSVMGPNWLPYLIFPSQVDGIWTRVEDMPPRIMMAGSNYDAEASMLHFNAWVSDVKGSEDIVTVEILFEGNEIGVRLYDDGTHGDANAHDGLFSLSIPAKVNDPIINVPYSLIAIDKNGLVSRGWPELTTTTKEENSRFSPINLILQWDS